MIEQYTGDTLTEKPRTEDDFCLILLLTNYNVLVIKCLGSALCWRGLGDMTLHWRYIDGKTKNRRRLLFDNFADKYNVLVIKNF